MVHDSKLIDTISKVKVTEVSTLPIEVSYRVGWVPQFADGDVKKENEKKSPTKAIN